MWRLVLILIVVAVIIMATHRENAEDAGFDPPIKTEAPGFTCPVPGTC